LAYQLTPDALPLNDPPDQALIASYIQFIAGKQLSVVVVEDLEAGGPLKCRLFMWMALSNKVFM